MHRINNGEPDGDGNKIGSSSCVDPVPQSLKEVAELMSSVNRRLEDCAVEWQATLSRKQWRILDAQSTAQTSWEQSLLARTYFTDKILDEAFEKLMVNEKKFMENFNNFIGLLKGENPISGMRDAENQCTSAKSPVVTPLDLSLLEDNKTLEESAGRRRSKRLAENSGNTVQQSFADLIKAKIDLDTKFLGFEAVLNGTGGTSVPPSEGAKCLCQICSSVLGSVINNDSILREAATKPKVRRMTRAKSKRLTKSPKNWKRNSERIANQSTISNTKNPPKE